jgi:hypothetical protein
MTLKQETSACCTPTWHDVCSCPRIPARFAYIAADGTPRVLATWFHWTGEVLAMPTFPSRAPRPPRSRSPLGAAGEPHVTIDTETFPLEVLTIRGRVEIKEAEAIPPEYESAAHRYLGDEAARAYLAQIDQPGTRMARSTFTQVGERPRLSIPASERP